MDRGGVTRALCGQRGVIGTDQDRGICSGCGDVVGLYEPAWIEFEDGTLHPSSLLNLDRDARTRARRIWHAGCVIDESPPPS